MKKGWMCMVVALLFLTGCRMTETFETIGNPFSEQPVLQRQEIVLQLPGEAAVPVSKTENGDRLYVCDTYAIAVQTLLAGNLDASIRSICGYSADEVTVVQTEQQDATRYAWVWTSAGEGGDEVGRGAILDDGNYHYALSVTASAQAAGELKEAWQALFESFGIQPPAAS